MTLATAMTATRLFPDRRFVLDVAVIIAVGHGVPALVRWWRLQWWAWAPPMVLGLALVLVVRFTGDTTRWGLPTVDTLRAWRQVWRFADEFLPTARPPVDYAAEWAALFGAAVAVTVLTTEVVAHLVRSPRWSLVPSGVMFTTLLVFGRGGGATTLTVVYVATTLTSLAVMAHRSAGAAPVAGLSQRRGRVTAGASTTVAFVTVIGVGLGPLIPSSGAEPWVAVRGRGGGGLLLDHPLVDIRGRLVDQSTVEMFTVTSDQPSYWRLASLAEFDGVTFEVPRREMRRLDTISTASATLRHEITITALPGRLVPAAPEPVLTERRDVRWHEGSASLIAARALNRPQKFVIVSSPPDLDASRLAGPATTSATTAPDAVYTSLPADLSPMVAATAREVLVSWGLDPATAVQRPYVAALALQDWFRREFTYDVDVTFTRDATAIADFLAQRRGYCEQFAIAFAAMARTLGIPARVAVGFTPGQRIDAVTWSVQGRHAHAWPEVWFADVGWVGFEPTPGRGAPGAEAYTGVSAAQDVGPGLVGPGPDGTVDLAPSTNDEPTALDDLIAFPEELPDVPVEEIDTATPAAADSPVPTLRAAGLGLIALLASGPVVARRLRDRRRRRLTAKALVDVVWPRLCSALRSVKVPVHEAMTPREVVRVTARYHPDVSRLLEPVVGQVERASYAPHTTTAATALLRQVATARALLRRKRRLLDRFADYVRPWRD